MRTAFLVSACLLTVGSFIACGGDDGAPTGDDPTSGNGGAEGGADATSTGFGGSGGLVLTASGGSSGTGGETGCLSEEAEAKTSPLDIVVLLDRSGSMAGSAWDGSVAALTSFFQSPGGAEISAAISYFPPPGNVGECQPASYNPPHVPLTDLATSASTLVTDIQSQTPGGAYTPTWGGLYGALQYANQVQDQNPDHVVIVVLASDGDPTTCNTDVPTIAGLAQQAYDYNGVRTFVIAIQGSTVSNLDQIAAAGQTVAALDVTTDINQFKQKMDEIRAQVLACEFIIPDPSAGDFDPTKVNVKYTPGSGSPEDIPQADNASDCGDDPGWYYDNPVAPTKITFCPASCATIQADAMAKVDFVFGCPTVVN